MTQRDSLPDITFLERLTRLEEKLDHLTSDVKEHLEKDSNLFFRYGWPIVQILIWIAIAVVITGKSGSLP